jgi:hypothetical protein
LVFNQSRNHQPIKDLLIAQVLSKDGGTQVGKISKQWAGILREMFTDADYFGITFPMDLDVKMKAVMIGACFLIVSTAALLQSDMLLFCKCKYVPEVHVF